MFERIYPRIKRKENRLERHAKLMRPVDFYEARRMQTMFKLGMHLPLISYIRSNLNRSAELKQAYPGTEEYNNLYHQWRGALAVLYPQYYVPDIDRNDVLVDTLLFLNSSMQDYRGITPKPVRKELKRMKMSRKGIKQVTSRDPVRPGYVFSDSDLYLTVKAKQTVVISHASDSTSYYRTFPAVDKLAIIANRALDLLNLAATSDPNLLTQAFDTYGREIEEPGEMNSKRIESPVGVLETIFRTGRLKDTRTKPLRDFLAWYVNNYKDVNPSFVFRYQYLATLRESNLFYKPAEKFQMEGIPPDLKPYRETHRKMESVDREIRSEKSPMNMYKAHLKIKKLRNGELKSRKVKLEKKKKIVMATYLNGWDQYLGRLAEKSGLQMDMANLEISEEDQRSITGFLSFAFAREPGVPSKASRNHELYRHREVVAKSGALRTLGKMIALSRYPVFKVNFRQIIENHPAAFYELFSVAFSEVLRIKYSVSPDKAESFLMQAESPEDPETQARLFSFEVLDLIGRSEPEMHITRRFLLRERQKILLGKFLLLRSMPDKPPVLNTSEEDQKPENKKPEKKRDIKPLMYGAVILTIASAGIYMLNKATDGKAPDIKALNHLAGWFDGLTKTPDGPAQATKWPKKNKESNSFDLPSVADRNKERPPLTKYAEILFAPSDFDGQIFMPTSGNPTGIEDITFKDATVDIKDFSRNQFNDDSIAIKLKARQSIFPPPGWTIVAVYTEGTKVGITHFSDGTVSLAENPGNMVVVMQQLDKIEPITQPETVKPYTLNLDEEEFNSVNQSIAADQILQKIHRDAFMELKAADDFVAQSQIIEKYLVLFHDYMQKNHFYSFTNDGLDDLNDGLVWAASHPDIGIECKTSDRITREFFKSLGVEVFSNPGVPLTAHGSFLFADWGHVKTLVRLPNGELVNVDNTPSMTEKTPQKESQLFSGLTPTKNQMDSEISGLPDKQYRGTGTKYMIVDMKEVGWIAAVTGLSLAAAAMYLSLMKKRIRPEDFAVAASTPLPSVFQISHPDILPSIRNTTPEIEENLDIRLDYSEKEIAVTLAHRLMTLPEDLDLVDGIMTILGAVSNYRPSWGKNIRGEYITEIAKDDEITGFFLSTDHKTVLDQLHRVYGPTMLHPSLPSTLAEEIRNPADEPSEEFSSYVTMVGAMWEASSGFAELKNDVQARLLRVPRINGSRRVGLITQEIDFLISGMELNGANKAAIEILKLMKELVLKGRKIS